jgi:DNA phosphorothioation-dependent restriction protein DptG
LVGGSFPRSPVEQLPLLALLSRLILADAHRSGVWLDRAEIRAVIELSDRYNKLTEVTP